MMILYIVIIPLAQESPTFGWELSTQGCTAAFVQAACVENHPLLHPPCHRSAEPEKLGTAV